jgi:hypothetical protein
MWITHGSADAIGCLRGPLAFDIYLDYTPVLTKAADEDESLCSGPHSSTVQL